eukprot:scaffold360_cov334-Prasinococcus_capsulatus_cf.AAC.6
MATRAESERCAIPKSRQAVIEAPQILHRVRLSHSGGSSICTADRGRSCEDSHGLSRFVTGRSPSTAMSPRRLTRGVSASAREPAAAARVGRGDRGVICSRRELPISAPPRRTSDCSRGAAARGLGHCCGQSQRTPHPRPRRVCYCRRLSVLDVRHDQETHRLASILAARLRP